MLYLKDNPIGIDGIIQDYQTKLYTSLRNDWGILNDTDWDCFGRVYRNNTDSGYKPEVFVNSSDSDNTKYRELYFDNDVNSLVSFFNVGDSTPYQFGHTVTIASIIFILNISKLYPNLDWRADEEAKQAIIKRIQWAIRTFPGMYGIEITGFETGYKNVFKDFDGLIKDMGAVTFRDKHPIFNLKVNINVHYNLFNS